VCDLQEDANGVLWVATGFAARGGAATWDEQSQTWERLDGPPGLGRAKIRSLFLDTNAGLWFCSEYDGVVICTPAGWQSHLYRKGFPCREVKDAVEADGGFWLATERGVIFLRHESIYPREAPRK
jgi:ligand-binding sensor domain-containing protein